MSYVVDEKRISDIRPDLPETLWLVLGYMCNANCYHCYTRGYKDEKFMDDAIIGKVMKLAKFIKNVILIGGEPTLYPRLNELLVDLKKRIPIVSMVSNGLKLSDRTFVSDLKNNGISEVSISVANDKKNNNNNYHKQLEALKNSVEIIGSMNVSAVLTIGYQDITDFKRIIDDCNSTGIKKLVLSSYIPIVHDPSEANDMATPIFELPLKIENIYNYIINKTNLDPSIYMNYPLCIFREPFVKRIFEAGHAVTGCHVITGHGIVIDPEGHLLPCTHWIDCYENSLTDIDDEIESDEKFKIYWKTGSPYKVSESLGIYRSENCIGCKYWGKLCLCGCPLLWLNYNPDEIISGIER